MIGKLKWKEKMYNAKKSLRTKLKEYKIDDVVLFRTPKTFTKKNDPTYSTNPYKIVDKNGSMITAQSTISNSIVTRNSSCFKMFNEDQEFKKKFF